jgi:hypothetical protein
MPKKVNKKKKTVQKQKQKQKQSINININSNNKKGGGKSSDQKKPQIPYYPPPQISTIVGGTGRGSEMNKGVVSNEIADLLKVMVEQNKNFSGIGGLSRHVNETTNRQSDLESRLTDQYSLDNDISDNSHTHYNNEERLNSAGFRPMRNYYTDDYSRYPTHFQSDGYAGTEQNDEENSNNGPPQLGYNPSFQNYPEPTESQPDEISTDQNYMANTFEQESPTVINFSGQYVQDSINQSIPQTNAPNQPLREDVIKQSTEELRDNLSDDDFTYPMIYQKSGREHNYFINPMLSHTRYYFKKPILTESRPSTNEKFAANMLESEKEKLSTDELPEKVPQWKANEQYPLTNFSFPKKEQDTLTDFSPQNNAFNQLQSPEKSLLDENFVPNENVFLDRIKQKKLDDELTAIRNEKNAKFTTNQKMINKLEEKGITSSEITNKHNELLKQFYRVGSKDELSLAKQHANLFLQSIGIRHLSSQGKENSINFLKSDTVMNKIDELQRQLGLVIDEFPQQKNKVLLSDRTITLNDIQTEKKPTKNKKTKITQESSTINDKDKSTRIEDI